MIDFFVMEIDVRCVMTHAERLREARRKNVAEEFARVAPVMLGEMGLSPERVIRFVADRFHLSVPGVKKYLREAGVYECNARLREQYQGSQTLYRPSGQESEETS